MAQLLGVAHAHVDVLFPAVGTPQPLLQRYVFP